MEATLTIEWSTPSCNDGWNGSSYALFGMPLPYERFSGVTSLQYDVVPYLYLIDIVLLTAAIWLLIRFFARRAPFRLPAWAGTPLAVAGILLCTGASASRIYLLLSKQWYPVVSLADFSYDGYFRTRPVGFSWDRHHDCTPSELWFGPSH